MVAQQASSTSTCALNNGSCSRQTNNRCAPTCNSKPSYSYHCVRTRSQSFTWIAHVKRPSVQAQERREADGNAQECTKCALFSAAHFAFARVPPPAASDAAAGRPQPRGPCLAAAEPPRARSSERRGQQRRQQQHRQRGLFLVRRGRAPLHAVAARWARARRRRGLARRRGARGRCRPRGRARWRGTPPARRTSRLSIAQLSTGQAEHTRRL